MSHYFTQDIFIEIFKRLSSKTLICCTLVCKSWYALISSPSFISTHLNHALMQNQTNIPQTLIIRHCAFVHKNIQEQCILLQDNENGEAVELHPPQKLINSHPQNNSGDFVTVGFFNGLLCLAANHCSEKIQTIILWNPSINKFITLPPHTLRRTMQKSLALVGFGAAHLSNGEYHYKVVRILFPLRKRLGQTTYIPAVEVFSVSNRSWRRIKQVDIRCRATSFVGCPALVNEVAHWVVFKPNMDGRGVCPSILAFDFCDELLREMTLPDAFVKDFDGNGYILELWDYLAAVKYDKSMPTTMFSVWVMKEYGIKESWTSLYNFDLINDVVHVVGFRKNGELFMSSRDHKLVLYDPVSKLIKEELGISSWPVSFYIGNYMESLVLLESCEGILKESLGLVDAQISDNDKANGRRGECSKKPRRKVINK